MFLDICKKGNIQWTVSVSVLSKVSCLSGGKVCESYEIICYMVSSKELLTVMWVSLFEHQMTVKIRSFPALPRTSFV